jgi:hypothetical protein
MKLQTSPAVASGASVDGGVFTGEQSLVEQFAGKILTCWHKSTAGILELARACADADSKLPLPAKKALIGRLPFDRSTFAKLVELETISVLSVSRRSCHKNIRSFMRCQSSTTRYSKPPLRTAPFIRR